MTITPCIKYKHLSICSSSLNFTKTEIFTKIYTYFRKLLRIIEIFYDNFSVYWKIVSNANAPKYKTDARFTKTKSPIQKTAKIVLRFVEYLFSTNKKIE